MFSREDCIFTLEKYERIISVIDGWDSPTTMFRTYIGYTDKSLNDEVFFLYKYLKGKIIGKITIRFSEYIQNRNRHIPNKTSDKEFYRFMKASGFSEKNLWEVPINRLISVYSVYFRKVG